MRITLLAFGSLRDHLGPATGSIELPARSTVRDLLARCRPLVPANTIPWSAIAVAVNQEYVPATHLLADGDEVALLPPVSGGSPKKIVPPQEAIPIIRIPKHRVHLSEEPIDALALASSLKRDQDGAVVVFDGIVRNNSRGRRTLYLFYEAYREMALNQMKLLSAHALAEFPIRDVAIVHRLGRLDIGETSVVIAVASAHRAAAFDACRWLIDTLKKTVPIWKKEFFTDGAVWAQGDPFPPELTPQARKSAVVRRPKKSARKQAPHSGAQRRSAQQDRGPQRARSWRVGVEGGKAKSKPAVSTHAKKSAGSKPTSRTKAIKLRKRERAR
jgi:molybdopterin synthase catalytic subunit